MVLNVQPLSLLMAKTSADPDPIQTSQPKQDNYPEFLKQDFQQLFDRMNLDDRQVHFMRSRWLDQVIWMEKKAAHCRDRHYQLRLTAIILGVIVPILVGLEPGQDLTSRRIFKGVTIRLVAE
jgi:hypothetical protein